MKKYEIRKNAAELKTKTDIKHGATLSQSDQDPVILESYDTKKEALGALKKYKSTFQKMDGYGAPYYVFEEIYVEENTYDSDGEWSAGGDVWGFAELYAD